MNETPVTVVGNVASEMRVRRFGPDEERVVGFRVASSERRWDRETQSWIDGDRFSAWVTCWRRLGDGVVRSLAKGDPVVVSGRLSVREYEADGQRRFSTEIVASAVGPDLSRSTATVARRRLTAVPDTGSDDAGATTSSDDDEDRAPSTGVAATSDAGTASPATALGGRTAEDPHDGDGDGDERDGEDVAHGLRADPVPSAG